MSFEEPTYLIFYRRLFLLREHGKEARGQHIVDDGFRRGSPDAPEVALPQRSPPRIRLERRAPRAGAMIRSTRDRPASTDGSEFGEPRNRRIVCRPYQPEPPTGHEHPIGLKQRAGAVKPVPRLRGHEHIDAAGHQRQRLGHGTEHRDFGDGGEELMDHLRQRLNRDDPRSRRRQLASQFASASSEVNHRRPSSDLENLDKVTHCHCGIAGPTVLETRGRRAEAMGDRMNWAPPAWRWSGHSGSLSQHADIRGHPGARKAVRGAPSSARRPPRPLRSVHAYLAGLQPDGSVTGFPRSRPQRSRPEPGGT